mgnify:CR=1 FL=1
MEPFRRWRYSALRAGSVEPHPRLRLQQPEREADLRLRQLVPGLLARPPVFAQTRDRVRGAARRELRLEILPLLRHQFYLGLDLFDLLLPILKDEQLLQFRLHARMLWAEPTIVNRAEP